MKRPTVPIGEVVRFQAGVGFPPALQGRVSGDLPFAKVGDISRHGRSGKQYIRTADHYVDNSDLKQLRTQPIAPGSTLFAKIGEAIRQNHRVIAAQPMLIDNNAMAAIPGTNVDPAYLFRFLQSVDLYQYATSTTVPSLRKSDLERIDIPLPTLSEQRRIAAILDHADALRVMRRRSIRALAELTDAAFIDCFGHAPEPSALLNDVATVSSGITKGRRTNDATSPIPYLAVANVQAGRLELGSVKTIDATSSEIERYRLEFGDLVLTEGGDPDKLGRGTVWRDELPLCLHQNHIFRVRIQDSSSLHPDYLSAFISSNQSRSYFLKSAKQTTGIASINMTQLKALPVHVPTAEAQLRYLDLIRSINAQRATVAASVSACDHLLLSLRSRAFRGEL
ncbi:restriction endonuclease subunit S [Mycobacterium sp. SMC-18]|uniref:restriction endonuclease subunit S n=1 Tax=Mycobacteriaceae TaxID=1762 RepID=UPI000EEE57CE|nr:restriction endonuclease subunit S [Mycolicibacterium sp. NCC-Tsukiji]GCB01749.1 hypothetical protein NCCNTM_53830 [Mycolicibacterium sp. NCC-Tsukiji]